VHLAKEWKHTCFSKERKNMLGSEHIQAGIDRTELKILSDENGLEVKYGTCALQGYEAGLGMSL
jgi:hypothetical protein